ncbi:Uncharacterised protein [Mycobacteroides abscessus]|nr:Uncharacterised protein [Mycobacteroides abscessus]
MPNRYARSSAATSQTTAGTASTDAPAGRHAAYATTVMSAAATVRAPPAATDRSVRRADAHSPSARNGTNAGAQAASAGSSASTTVPSTAAAAPYVSIGRR